MQNANENTSSIRRRRQRTPSLTGMKMVTIEKIDQIYVVRPHTVRQYRKRRITFYNSTSHTVELHFSMQSFDSDWPPFEENGPYVLTGGELLTLRLKPDPQVRGTYPYEIEELEPAFVEEAAVEDEAEYAGADSEPDSDQDGLSVTRLMIRRGNPEMIID